MGVTDRISCSGMALEFTTERTSRLSSYQSDGNTQYHNIKGYVAAVKLKNITSAPIAQLSIHFDVLTRLKREITKLRSGEIRLDSTRPNEQVIGNEIIRPGETIRFTGFSRGQAFTTFEREILIRSPEMKPWFG